MKFLKKQPVTDWYLNGVLCEILTEAEAPILCSNIKSVSFSHCEVPRCFVRSILRQLFNSTTLETINFEDVRLNVRNDAVGSVT